MSSLNQASLIGHLGRDPEIRSTQTGGRVATLSLATSEQWTDKQSGERREATEWHRIVIFNDRLVDLAEKYMHKGDRIFVQGQIKTRKWTDQQNVERYTTEILLGNFEAKVVLLGNRRGNGDDGDTGTVAGGGRAPAQHPDLDDDIPF